MGKFADLYYSKKIVVEIPKDISNNLDETKKVSIGQYTAFKHPLHTGGDSKHGVCELPGGYEVSWTISGERRHEIKFPTSIPKDAKLAIANVIGVSPEILESFKVEYGKKSYILIEFNMLGTGE
ncbi:MAG TPA: hypothetical protein VHO70_12085 [Chitinispirillaceae bacterium]|nr:hypothetical protein [Chitinispirillaceae bacterium]